MRAGLEVVMVTTVSPTPPAQGQAHSRSLLSKGMNERETRKGDVGTVDSDGTGQTVLFWTDQVCQALPGLEGSAQPITPP